MAKMDPPGVIWIAIPDFVASSVRPNSEAALRFKTAGGRGSTAPLAELFCAPVAAASERETDTADDFARFWEMTIHRVSGCRAVEDLEKMNSSADDFAAPARRTRG
jgi:hypothetical protein